MSKNPTRASSRMRMEPKYVRRRQRGLAVLIASLVLIVGSIIYIGMQVSTGGGSSHRANAKDFEGNGNGVVQLVEIPEGSSVSALGPELEKRGIVKTNSAFQAAAGANPDASNVTPGFYRLQEEMNSVAAVKALLDPANKVEMLDIPGGATLTDVKVVGGKTRPGIYSDIARVSCSAGSENCLKVEDLSHVAATVDPAVLGVPEWAIKDVQARGEDPRRLEGLIVPGQYVVNPELDAEGVLKDLITRSAKVYQESGIVDRAKALNLSPYQLLVAASLVEREAPAGDFDKVARVILNRLNEPQRLEFDSTVNYDLAEQEVATTDEDRQRVTPWNTYAMDGLPSTPIAAPSEEAIRAMEKPADGDWLYFVTIDKEGHTVFNRDFEAHLRDTKLAEENGVLDSQR